jgi:hypothetical protein
MPGKIPDRIDMKVLDALQDDIPLVARPQDPEGEICGDDPWCPYVPEEGAA